MKVLARMCKYESSNDANRLKLGFLKIEQVGKFKKTRLKCLFTTQGGTLASAIINNYQVHPAFCYELFFSFFFRVIIAQINIANAAKTI